MMMKQLIQKAKTRFFESDELSGRRVRRIANPFDMDILERPALFSRPSAEQQRIELLENQIRQLRADMARWKSTSLGFAHEMRDLLND